MLVCQDPEWRTLGATLDAQISSSLHMNRSTQQSGSSRLVMSHPNLRCPTLLWSHHSRHPSQQWQNCTVSGSWCWCPGSNPNVGVWGELRNRLKAFLSTHGCQTSALIIIGDCVLCSRHYSPNDHFVKTMWRQKFPSPFPEQRLKFHLFGEWEEKKCLLALRRHQQVSREGEKVKGGVQSKKKEEVLGC